MFTRLFVGALLAGLCAGALAALIQLTFVVPLIVEAELYETGALTHFGAAATQDHRDPAAAPAADPEVPAPAAEADHPTPAATEPGQSLFGRSLGTVAMFLVTYTGFALLLVAGFALVERIGPERAGHQITARTGAIWGIFGFLAVQLAPAFGLPPELPGGQGAALEARQLWWAACVLATAGGLGLLAFGRNALALGTGALLLAAPHLLGAPTAAFAGVAPPELSAHFTARVLGAGAVCWALLGTIAGAVWAKKV